MHFTILQRMLISLLFFMAAITGFMVKLPSTFRHMDKELHSVFYFGASALLNLLFAGKNFWRHILIFVTLFLFGIGIEFAQEYSNHFFHRRIHGRFDWEDVRANLKGLLIFSGLWVFICLVLLTVGRNSKTRTVK